jgi:hypothetical protein
MEFNRDKFKALVLYICAAVEDRDQLGLTKLNKILWYSDAIAYLKWREPITGETYDKRQFGPMPRDIYTVIEELEAAKVLAVSVSDHFGYKKKEFIPLIEAKTDMFSADQIALVDDIIQAICDGHTAKSISKLSHDEIWKMAKIGEELPYEAVLVSRLGELDGADMAWATERAAAA